MAVTKLDLFTLVTHSKGKKTTTAGSWSYTGYNVGQPRTWKQCCVISGSVQGHNSQKEPRHLNTLSGYVRLLKIGPLHLQLFTKPLIRIISQINFILISSDHALMDPNHPTCTLQYNPANMFSFNPSPFYIYSLFLVIKMTTFWEQFSFVRAYRFSYLTEPIINHRTIKGRF